METVEQNINFKEVIVVNWDRGIINGTIVTPKDIFKGNVYIKDGKIAAISTEDFSDNCKEVIDASNLHIFPGFMDTHVHSRDGGAPEKEDFFHSTQAAAAGGLTTIFEMPNAIPAVINKENFDKQLSNLSSKAHVDFAMWGLCLGDLNNKDLQELKEAGVIGFKFFWGYAINSETYQLIYNYDKNAKNVIPPLKDGEVYEIFEEVEKTGKIISIHAENADLIETLTEKIKKSGDLSYEGLLEARPNLVEETVVNTAISFSKATNARLHVLHASAAETVDLVEEAQRKGLNVTVETCPHFLFLNDKDYDRIGSMMKVYPPIKRKADQEKLWEGIQNGIVDLVCSDHAPHTAVEKDGELWDIPSGMCGVESLAPLMIDSVNDGKITKQQLAAVLSENPAKLFGIYPNKGSLEVGTDADITIVDFEKEHIIEKEKLHSVSKVTAFDGFEIKGMPVATIVRGNVVMRDGEIIGDPVGEFINPEQM